MLWGFDGGGVRGGVGRWWGCTAHVAVIVTHTYCQHIRPANSHHFWHNGCCLSIWNKLVKHQKFLNDLLIFFWLNTAHKMSEEPVAVNCLRQTICTTSTLKRQLAFIMKEKSWSCFLSCRYKYFSFLVFFFFFCPSLSSEAINPVSWQHCLWFQRKEKKKHQKNEKLFNLARWKKNLVF